MALKKRILRVTFSNNQEPLLINEDLDVRVKIRKMALDMQQRAEIEIVGLNSQVRSSLLSQFTAWNRRRVDTGDLAPAYTNVSVVAGYMVDGVEQVAEVFAGQVVQVDLSSTPPDIGVRIECYTQQLNKASFKNGPPPVTCTFYEYVKWAAETMGFGSNFDCQTSFNDRVINNPARSWITTEAIIWDIQNYYRPDVTAFIDNARLIVRDRNKIIDKGAVPEFSEFVGIPSWQQWGVNVQMMMDIRIKLTGGMTILSQMNPTLNGTYVIHTVEYELCSRRPPFFVRAIGAPPA